MDKTTLYVIDAKGLERLWSIEPAIDGYHVSYGVVGGEIQKEFTPIDFGMSNRTQEVQIQQRVQAKIKKRLENGYSRTLEIARKKGGKGFNDLGLPRAMLAKRYEQVDIDPSEMYLQAKYDGMRCMIYKSGDTVIAYSRNGKPIEAIEEIIDTVRGLPIKEIILDGELYTHGVKLQTILSWAKRRQEETKKLVYVIYDCVSADPFEERITLLRSLIHQNYFRHISLASTNFHCLNVSFSLRAAKHSGYEGLILRCPESGYEPGKRSSSLIKVKSMMDDEFKVLSIKSSADNWAILTCAYKEKTFNVSAPGNMKEKKYVLENPDEFLGRRVTVEYSTITADGIPFHPVATSWREKCDE